MINPEKLGLDHLSKFLPHIAIATSNNYVEKMKIPYQATSFVGAKIRPTLKSIYAYKLSGKPAEAYHDELLTGMHFVPVFNCIQSTEYF